MLYNQIHINIHCGDTMVIDRQQWMKKKKSANRLLFFFHLNSHHLHMKKPFTFISTDTIVVSLSGIWYALLKSLINVKNVKEQQPQTIQTAHPSTHF